MMDAAPRRLLFVANAAWFFVSHRLPLARAAIEAGYDVHLACDFEELAEIGELKRSGVHFHRVRLVRGGLNPLSELRTYLELRDVIRVVSPAIVHNITAKPIIYGSAAARALGVPGVVNAVSGFGYAYSSPSASRRLMRRALASAYARAFSPPGVRIIVQNADDRAEVARLCPPATPRIVLVPGSGVDLKEFHRTPEPAGTPMVLLPARLLREKGVLEFTAAAGELRRAGAVARFVLAGRLDPANRGALSATQIQQLCASEGVEWIGDCKDMPRLLADSSIVCLPSYREGMPKVLLEACAAGRPIITSDTPGCRDVVPEGRNGLLVPPRDARRLASAMRQLLDDVRLRSTMGAESRRLAEARFGVEQVVQAHLGIYRDLSGRA
ncbi:MAG: glycosyltransferase family 4 protein [Proteobacteria bacterium]|nr:glycosyltransferase family 4 protein [Pseudomonadota bacterium]